MKNFYFDNAKLKYNCIYWMSKGLVKAGYYGDINFNALSANEIDGYILFLYMQILIKGIILILQTFRKKRKMKMEYLNLK
mgnify:CR=1 FL=1